MGSEGVSRIRKNTAALTAKRTGTREITRLTKNRSICFIHLVPPDYTDRRFLSTDCAD
jgi:hypothetical protein